MAILPLNPINSYGQDVKFVLNIGSFTKKNGSQEDNQASKFGCPHLFFGRRGHMNISTLTW